MKNLLRILMTVALATVAFACHANAQATGSSGSSGAQADVEKIQSRVDGVDAQVQVIQTDLDKLKKIKVSGYIQARYDVSETSHDAKVSGSPAAIKNANLSRIYIRRGRLKVTYDSSPLSQAVIYFDGGTSGTDQAAATPKNLNSLGLVRLLEAYVTLRDPWTPDHRHSINMGQMNIPFGYEIERSSSVRELPERSKAENVLFPGERDRMITLTDQWTPQLQTVIGVLNGTGINNTDLPTTTYRAGKDFLARARWSQGIFDVAASAYVGKNKIPLTYDGGKGFTHDKTRYGADAQYYYSLPTVGGGSLKAEFYTGHEVNPDSVKALTGSLALNAGKDVHHLATDFVGYYGMMVQNLGEQLQFAARYDHFDPNTNKDHDQYSRVGLGFNYFYDSNIRVTLAYDIPTTDVKTNGTYTDPKDNLWTLQLQHKF